MTAGLEPATFGATIRGSMSGYVLKRGHKWLIQRTNPASRGSVFLIRPELSYPLLLFGHGEPTLPRNRVGDAAEKQDQYQESSRGHGPSPCRFVS